MAPGDGERYDSVVDAAGDGDYASVQAAIDDAKSFPRERVRIFVADGVYDEKVAVHSWNPRITLVGESVDGTVITHDDHFGSIDRGPNSTFFTYTLQVCGNDFRARNLTVRNSAGPDADQAVALHVESDRAVFEHCRFVGNQDTLYAAGEGARQYFHDCHVEGTTDFVFGNGTAVFEACTVHSKADSYVTAAATPASEPFGYVFRDCSLTADPAVSEVYLGRPWRDHAHVAVVESELAGHVHPAGWDNWSRPGVEDTVTYVESANRGPGANTAERVDWASELTAADAERYATENVLLGDESGDPGRYWYRFE